MKAVIGVDLDGLYESALCLFARLQFENAQIELVHVDETPPVYPEGDQSWIPEFLDVQDEIDQTVLLRAGKSAESKGVPFTTLAVMGAPADYLIERATENKADLIAVGSYERSPVTSLFFGSVGRALTLGAHHSILIGKGAVETVGPITAVVTTDHSKYSDQAIRLLARLKPLGIKRLVVLTALTDKMIGSADEEHVDRLRNYMALRSESIVQHLGLAGISSESRVVEGELDEVIDAQMHEEDADLLIMGAQGHGFIERLFIGSSSLKQVVATRHSILLLRPSASDLA